eukprot:TRINITY_DN1272_c0_g1_i1.p1 TRINITY_DN1272_c0_g1~~TRINITY_DN1272_c0_g1_i1.p1  ORF type:complete len:281 (+),score=122.29 TRINITY_DN1272_c0_g1_i1:63-845(+)
MAQESNTRRIPFFGGNWKCNGSRSSVAELVAALNKAPVPKGVEVVLAPTTIHLDYVMANVKKCYQVSAQNCSATGNGAFTGEISANMLKDFGVKWVILGHSERRQLYGETDALVGKKVKAALNQGLSVIACVGETLDERKANQTLDVCFRQLKAIGDNTSDWSRMVIAYEPVWAIGTGMTATPQQAQDVHAALRGFLKEQYGAQVAAATRIIYGGSVKASNAQEIVSKTDVDGALVGGASLVAKEFVGIFSARKYLSSNL